MPHPAWTLVIFGLLLVGVGLLWLVAPHLPIGRLPGDLVIQRPHFRLYLPITTCIILSLLLSGLFWLVRLFQR